MIPTNPAQFPQGQQPITMNSGVLTQFGRFLMLAIFSRTGGPSGVPIEVNTDLAATGSTQADALALTKDWNEVLTVPAGAGVQVATLQPGQSQRVYNGGGAGPLKVYPPDNAAIDALGANVAYSLAAGKTQEFDCYETTQFRSIQWG